MPLIDYDAARKVLEEEFSRVESEALVGKQPQANQKVANDLQNLFKSKTQSFREVFIGCLLARLSDRTIDIHKPYVKQGEHAYNGRTLDEKVVNPFFRHHRIPSSGGPFLASLRRSVGFDKATQKGVKDKVAFTSLLSLVDLAAATDRDDDLLSLLRYTLFLFFKLRSEFDIPLLKLQRISLEQYAQLIDGLLGTPSGGRFPMMLAEATFTAINYAFKLQWEIEVQGINVADKPSGAGADITIKQGGKIVMAAEVTERNVDKSRVVSTFQTKIAPQRIEDYLFLVTGQADEEVLNQTRQYFSQGNEINFLEMKNWILTVLATIGKAGRTAFNETLLQTLSDIGVPAPLKMAWNKQMEAITAA